MREGGETDVVMGAGFAGLGRVSKAGRMMLSVSWGFLNVRALCL